MLWGCKFRNPVILTAGGGSPVRDGSACKNRIEVSIFRGTNIDPISAIEVFTHIKPAQAIRYIQIKPAVPPLTSAMIEVLPSVSSLRKPSWKMLCYH
jgi:hypothetical protein